MRPACMWSVVAVATLSAVGCQGGRSAGPSAARPNVVFVLTDDMRWDAMSLAHGVKSPLQTPNIDRLGREGVYFRNAFATTSLCSPSRASILTGQYAHVHGVKDNFTEFPAGTRTWPLALQENGYETAYVGKYHMGEANDEPRPGFTYFATHRGQGQYVDTEWRINGGERRVIPGYYTTVVSSLAEEWIRGRSPDRPWAITIGHKAPHSFYVPEAKYEICLCRRAGAVSIVGLHARRQTGLVQGSIADLARHLRAALRLPQELPRSVASWGGGIRRDGAVLLADDSER